MTDEQRDAHLREALRHAPDAQVQPPAALSALILNEARAKARDAATPARAPRHPLFAVWDWLARPPVATGFAGVMVATLVGLMWWDQPMDPAMPHRPEPSTAPAAAPAPAPVAATPPVATAPKPVPAPTVTTPEADKKAARPATAAAPTATRDEAAADRATGAAGAALAERAEARAPAQPPQVAAAPPPPGPAAPSETEASTAAGAGAKAKSADESRRQRDATFTGDALGRMAKTEANATASRLAAATTRLAPVRAAIAAEPARWAWQRDNGAVQDMNDAVYAWLAQLDGAAGARWQPRASVDATTPPGRELRLLREGRLVHTLRLTERSVMWDSGQSSWLVELPAATLKALNDTAP